MNLEMPNEKDQKKKKSTFNNSRNWFNLVESLTTAIDEDFVQDSKRFTRIVFSSSR